MSDFPLTAFLQVIPITSISLVDSTTLDIRGNDVSNTTRVTVNGIDATEYVIASKHRVLVTIPKNARRSELRTVGLIGKSNEAAIVTFNSKSTQAMTDSIYVVQRFMRMLLMSPGSNVFNLEAGANLTELIGANLEESIEPAVVQKIRQAELQVKQSQEIGLPDSKYLSVVNVNSISYSVNKLEVFVSLTLEMLDGSTVTTDFNIAG